MNRRRVWVLSLLSGVLFLVGCAGVKVQDYADVQPTFDPIAFFNGELVAEGLVQNRSGEVTRHFVATIDAYWDEERGVLDEVFLFSDGEESERYWEFTRTGPNTWTGTAGDVVGESRLVHAGNAIQMRYRLSVPLSSGRNVVLDMDDWLYQVSDQTLINETVMRKFGFRVGKLILTIRKLD
ncbi:DUF3833 domain-containing protein [Salinispirillum marinum]|uniref:DUF3833 domain-containing protein n=2 Tax=Saccharospirillaceae TaxID=255527 RepID=A0ABV8BDB6_9GAMM